LGVAKAVGMDVFVPEGATGGVDTDYKAKARKAVELLRDYDFVFVHLKGTDAASHDGLVETKVKMIRLSIQARKNQSTIMMKTINRHQHQKILRNLQVLKQRKPLHLVIYLHPNTVQIGGCTIQGGATSSLMRSPELNT